MHREKLLLEIEQSRQKMNRIGKEKPLFSEEMIDISTYLDDLMNQYQKQQLHR